MYYNEFILFQVDVATDAEDSNESSEEVAVGNKMYRTVRQRMNSRRATSFHYDRGQRREPGHAQVSRMASSKYI